MERGGERMSGGSGHLACRPEKKNGGKSFLDRVRRAAQDGLHNAAASNEGPCLQARDGDVVVEQRLRVLDSPEHDTGIDLLCT